jgi:hypothetical protein
MSRSLRNERVNPGESQHRMLDLMAVIDMCETEADYILLGFLFCYVHIYTFW